MGSMEKGVQKRMHKHFNFPIDCFFPQRVYRRVDWQNDTLIPIKEKGSDVYNVFEKIDIIPRLDKAIKNPVSERALKESIKKWALQYGFLTGQKQDALSQFMKEAQTLTEMWDMLKAISSRKLETLKKYIRIRAVHEIEAIANPEMKSRSTFNFDETPDVISFSFWGDAFFKEAMEEINKNPLPFYQVALFNGLTNKVLREINGSSEIEGVKFFAQNIWINSSDSKDSLTFKPMIQPTSFIQALYLQIFILLSSKEFKKICVVCGQPFPPTRKDREYCSDTCKNTGKSQRRRANMANKLKEGK